MKDYIIMLFILISLSACGQKGDLFLEEQKPPPPVKDTQRPVSEKALDDAGQ